MGCADGSRLSIGTCVAFRGRSAMTAETRRRWWGVVLVAGVLVLLIAWLAHGGPHARRAAAAPDAAAKSRAAAILHRWRASTRAAPNHGHDLAAPPREAEAKL